MNFSKTTEYSLRILSFMAVNTDRLYNVDMLKDEVEIPYRYLKKQMTRLVKSGLLTSIKGKHGGYKIARPLSDISLYDIVEANGDVHMSHTCLFGFDSCVYGEKCILHDRWEHIQNQINELLKNTTLQELKENGPKRFIQHNLMLTK